MEGRNSPSLSLTPQAHLSRSITATYISYVGYLIRKELSLLIASAIRTGMRTIFSTAVKMIGDRL
jgi:hypothetical protein